MKISSFPTGQAESILPLILNPKFTVNVDKRGKSRLEISIDHYRNFCKKAKQHLAIPVIKKLPDGYEI